MATPVRVRFKAEDVWQTPEDGRTYEVIDGDLYVSPPPLVRHQRGVGRLYEYLAPHVRRRRMGEVFVAPIGVVLDEESGVQPDLVYVSIERAQMITEKAIQGAPDLVVEVLSPSTLERDRGIKMRRYAAAGVPHYWLLDPEMRTLQPYRLCEHGYEPLGTYGPGAIFRPELFPVLEIPVDDLWA